MKTYKLVLIILTLCCGAELRAQDVLLQPGDKIRLVTMSEQPSSYTGKLVTIDEDTLIATLPGDSLEVVIAFSDIAKLEVYRGKRDYAGAGFVWGGVIGAIVGSVPSGFERNYDGELVPKNTGQVLVGAFLGALFGAAIGASEEGERWQRVDVRQGWYFPAE